MWFPALQYSGFEIQMSENNDRSKIFLKKKNEDLNTLLLSYGSYQDLVTG